MNRVPELLPPVDMFVTNSRPGARTNYHHSEHRALFVGSWLSS